MGVMKEYKRGCTKYTSFFVMQQGVEHREVFWYAREHKKIIRLATQPTYLKERGQKEKQPQPLQNGTHFAILIGASALSSNG